MKKPLFLLTLFSIVFSVGFVAGAYPAYLTDNLVSCWTFDETSGTTTIDYGLGQQNNGTNNGMTVNIASQTASLGKAYFYDGTSTNNVSMFPSSSLNISNVVIIAVVNFSGTGDREIANGRTNTAGYPLGIASGTSFFKPVVSGLGDVVQGGLLNTNNILMIATHTNANGTLYVNGSLAVTASTTAGTLLNSPTWTVGGSGALNGGSYYISELVILNATDFNETASSLIWNEGTILSCGGLGSAPTASVYHPANNSERVYNISVNFTINETAGTGALTNITHIVWFNGSVFNSTLISITDRK